MNTQHKDCTVVQKRSNYFRIIQRSFKVMLTEMIFFFKFLYFDKNKFFVIYYFLVWEIHRKIKFDSVFLCFFKLSNEFV